MISREDRDYYERKFEESEGSLFMCMVCLIGIILCLLFVYLVKVIENMIFL